MTSWVTLAEEEDEEFKQLNNATTCAVWSAAKELADLRGTSALAVEILWSIEDKIKAKRELVLRLHPDMDITWADYYRRGELMSLDEGEAQNEAVPKEKAKGGRMRRLFRRVGSVMRSIFCPRCSQR